MRRAWLAAVTAGLLLTAAAAASPQMDFDALVGRVAAGLHCQPLHPHLLGVASFFVRLRHPHEMRGMHLAYFEATGATSLEAVAQALDAGWRPVVRHEDLRTHEQASIFVRPVGKMFQMLVANLDPGGGVALVSLEVKPQDLIRELDLQREKNGNFGGARQ